MSQKKPSVKAQLDKILGYGKYTPYGTSERGNLVEKCGNICRMLVGPKDPGVTVSVMFNAYPDGEWICISVKGMNAKCSWQDIQGIKVGNYACWFWDFNLKGNRDALDALGDGRERYVPTIAEALRGC